MRPRLWFGTIITMIALLVPRVAGADDRVPGELIIKFRAGVSAAEKSSLVTGQLLERLAFTGAELWRVRDGASTDKTAKAIAADPRVEYAEPNYLLHAFATPNDPLFGQMWGLHNTGQVLGGVAGTPDADIDAPEAWDVVTGSSSVVVAVIDTGIDYLHTDLAANVWTNAGEIAGNDLDDDGNGYIDDIHGWDFVNSDGDPIDDNGHGTSCSGIIGAVADNGVGIAGISWAVRIMPMKFLDDNATGTTAEAILAIGYATAMGADVISCSWGSRSSSSALTDAIRLANDADIFFVAAAGNDGTNNDYDRVYPSGSDVGNVISVMATDNRDQRAIESNWASNYGAATVDIAAPGVRIWSTIRGGGTMYLSGTSVAAPHVAGALALLRARFPGISVADGRARLLGFGNDRLASLSGLCASSGRLNLRKLVADPDTIAPDAVIDLAAADVASNQVTLSWTAPADNGAVQAYEVRYASSAIDNEVAWAAAAPAPGAPSPAPAGTPVTMRIASLQPSTAYHFAVRARDDYGNLGGLSNSLAIVTLAAPTIAVSATGLAAALPPGNTTTRTLTIANTGDGVLDVTIPGNDPVAGVPGRGDVPRAAGGPDDFGYHWTDSDTPGGPAFRWIDIARTGIAVSPAAGTSEGPFPIGFTFPFYDGAFTTFHIDPRGYITLSPQASIAANTPLPSPAAPRDLIALLWDDLIQEGGTCHYLYDGTRLVVQYTGWFNSATGERQTMQLHLYPGGDIEFHYLTLTAAAPRTATIGIQDATGARGLTVSSDATYGHDDLAIRFARLPRWLSASPAEAHLAAGASVDVTVTFDAQGLCGSGYAATLHVVSNDPLRPDVPVPVTLTLAGAQDISAAPSAIAFGTSYIGRVATRDCNVTNRGCSDLAISGLEIDLPQFATPQSLPLVLPPGTTVAIPVNFAPTAAGAASAHLTIVSDDADTPRLAVPLGGTGLDAPAITVSPAALADTAAAGAAATMSLLIANNGAADLHFAIPTSEYPPLAAGTGGQPTSTKGAGGPDTFGYHWLDSDQLYGPEFDWVEIEDVGTRIPFAASEVNLGPYALGFTFPFYGSEFTQFNACSNGWISFTDHTSVIHENTTLPNPHVPGNMIAAFWDDLDFTGGRGSAWYLNDGQRLIIEYKDVPRLFSAGACTFQIHLYPSGRIEIHYLSSTLYGDFATIGLQNGDGTVGLTVVNNAPYVHNGLAIRFDSVRPWLSATPSSGTVAPGASRTVNVRCDAFGLCGDDVRAILHVLSDDPESPDLGVPVLLHVPPAPAARLSVGNLAFGNVDVTESATLAVALADTGCATLQVTHIAIFNSGFRTDAVAPFDVEPGASRSLNVTFTPTAGGPAPGTMVLTTNDPNQREQVIRLAGNGINPAVIAVTPAELGATVAAGEATTLAIHVENTGSGALEFSVPAPDFANKSAGAPAGALGQGGADAFGYRWIDSDADGGPAFDWIDIAETGTAALTNGDNATTEPIPIGFQFAFYDRRFATFRLCSNGWLSFSSSGTDAVNRALPTALAPRNLVAPFWDDLDLDAPGPGTVYYENIGEDMVVQWDRVVRRGTTTPLTFQVVLEPSGVITFRYLTVAGAVTTSATVGIQDVTGAIGLQVVADAAYLHDNLAVRLTTIPDWARVTPLSGTIPAGGSQDLSVTLDTAGLGLGIHRGVLHLLSNDPASPDVSIPLTLEVATPGPGATPTALVLAPNVPNPFRTGTLIRAGIPARGAIELRIFDLRGALVRTLASGTFDAGFRDYTWDGLADDGGRLPSGVYICRLKADGSEVSRRMILVK